MASVASSPVPCHFKENDPTQFRKRATRTTRKLNEIDVESCHHQHILQTSPRQTAIDCTSPPASTSTPPSSPPSSMLFYADDVPTPRRHFAALDQSDARRPSMSGLTCSHPTPFFSLTTRLNIRPLLLNDHHVTPSHAMAPHQHLHRLTSPLHWNPPCFPVLPPSPQKLQKQRTRTRHDGH
ncbi:hypothetical protein BC829DRAFT_119575 [Chytridium lagenaria]|nr:hypothetical protein BC829DRAFT_119575 [Chytridium lagenaria]